MIPAFSGGGAIWPPPHRESVDLEPIGNRVKKDFIRKITVFKRWFLLVSEILTFLYLIRTNFCADLFSHSQNQFIFKTLKSYDKAKNFSFFSIPSYKISAHLQKDSEYTLFFYKKVVYKKVLIRQVKYWLSFSESILIIHMIFMKFWAN